MNYSRQLQQESVDASIARLAATRHGVFSRSDALRLRATVNMIDWRIKNRRWEVLHRCVYRLAGAPPSFRQRVMAACLVWDGYAYASHRTAAALRELIRPGPVDITVPRGQRHRVAGVTIHESDLSERDVTVVQGIPVTTVERTLIDIGAVIPRRVLDGMLDDALQRGLTSMQALCKRVDELGRSGRRGIGVMRALLAQRDEEQNNKFERLLGRVLMHAGLPPPVPQFRVREGGRCIARVDYAYPDVRLAIEADSYRWHTGRARWKTDLTRHNELMALGWRILHVTWEDLNERPGEVVARVRQALAQR